MIFYLATPEFHGIPWKIPWKSRVIWYWIEWQSQSFIESQGTKWYFIWRHDSSMEFHGIFHGIAWNNCVIWNGALLIPWNHLELGGFFLYLTTPEFHGILWIIPWKSRITWYWIKDNLRVPWNSMELCDLSFGGTEIPWNSMEYSMEFHGTKWYFN